jgi:hypothetical protein
LIIKRAGAEAKTSGAEPAYTIATLVNNPALYEAMLASFRAHGFREPDCEFLHVGSPPCAYAALNRLLAEARGRHIILCHQDIRLIGDGRGELDQRLAELDRLDAAWALAGNAGGAAPGVLALRISDPHGSNRRVGRLPARVMSLDENFIVVRRAARIGFSRDLEGFHLYGADICLAADILGHSAWVIDFHLEHLSPGNKDQSFRSAEAAFRAKWSRALRPRWMQTTCTLLHLAGAPVARLFGRLGEGTYRWLSRRLGRARGWTGASGDVRGAS